MAHTEIHDCFSFFYDVGGWYIYNAILSCKNEIHKVKHNKTEECVFLRDTFAGLVWSPWSLHCPHWIDYCIYSIDQSILLFSIPPPIPRGRRDTCSDSFGKSIPPAALVFFGTWRRTQTTSSRSSQLASMGKAKPAKRSIFAPSRRQTASPPTAPIKVSCSEILHFSLVC